MAQAKLQNESFLNAALEGLELQKARIDEQIREVRSMLSHGGVRRRGQAAGNTTEKPARKRRILSSAARKRIAAAQKARWAKFRKVTPETKE